jgi:hypothetical protein
LTAAHERLGSAMWYSSKLLSWLIISDSGPVGCAAVADAVATGVVAAHVDGSDRESVHHRVLTIGYPLVHR